MHSIFGKHDFSTEEDPHHSESAGTTINEHNLTLSDKALIKYYQKNHQQLQKSFQIQHIDHDVEKSKKQNNNDNDNDNDGEDDVEEEKIDGGYGWFIVLAAFLVQMTGVMQDYYQQHIFGSSPSVIFQLNLVGATANSIMNLMSLLSQIILSRFGSRCGIFIACLCCSFGLELASLSTELWHLLLTQGLIFGIGCSIIFYVGMSVIPQWFNKREGIALGLASSGSCIGGLVMPFIMTPLNRQLGASWCYRILGFINLIVGIIACILFKDRKVTHKVAKNNKKIKDIIDFSVLKNMDLIIWCIADTFIEAGYYVPYFFLPSYATHLGLSDSQGSLLVSIASVCNAFGRIIAGHIGDKIGYINTTILSCLITSSSCFFLWTFAFDYTKLMLFAILFGTFGGIFIAQGASITRIVTGKEKFETGYAMFLLLTVIAMYGPNLSTFIETSLLHHNNINPYFSYKLFTAFCYMIGSIFLIYLKLKLSKYKLLIRL